MSVRNFWGLAKMPIHSEALARTRRKTRPHPLGAVQGQLVKSEDLAPSLEDVALEAAAHTKCIHLQSGHLLNTQVIGFSPYIHCGFTLLARKLHILDHLGRDRGVRLVQLMNNLFSTT